LSQAIKLVKNQHHNFFKVSYKNIFGIKK